MNKKKITDIIVRYKISDTFTCIDILLCNLYMYQTQTVFQLLKIMFIYLVVFIEFLYLITYITSIFCIPTMIFKRSKLLNKKQI